MDSNERYIRIEEEGVPYFCPSDNAKDIENARQAIHSDECVEADVVQRYSGQIHIEKNTP
ncbi:MAG: hypothetical protein KQI78_23410 [Deltaproteobacteria bacterium]|nr:hypothetical protein [Deltaproteobacteria bacterium]